MNHFRTVFKYREPAMFEINHSCTIQLLGSCFAENMVSYFKKDGFDVSANPFGILYNPISIAKLLKLIVEKRDLDKGSFITNNNGTGSLLLHSSFAAKDEYALQKKFNDMSNIYYEKLTSLANVHIISIGTSWIYEHIDKKIICGNCHKLPQSQFRKRLLSINEVSDALNEIATILKQSNTKIIFTVSPVRHLKDGFENNQLSKSILHLCMQEVKEKNDNVFYFPAYEIMMDDLRDYRFYESDLLHPNRLAISYLYDFFWQRYFSETTQQICEQISKYVLLKNHKLMSKEIDKVADFKQKILDEKKRLVQTFPNLEKQLDSL